VGSATSRRRLTTRATSQRSSRDQDGWSDVSALGEQPTTSPGAGSYPVADLNWARLAGLLEWTCWQTIDHTIDCVYSFALQVGAQADSGFLTFAPMYAEATGTPSDLIRGLGGASALLVAIARDSPQDRTASDGIVSLSIPDWGVHELLMRWSPTPMTLRSASAVRSQYLTNLLPQSLEARHCGCSTEPEFRGSRVAGEVWRKALVDSPSDYRRPCPTTLPGG
jgi:hypothetical protein